MTEPRLIILPRYGFEDGLWKIFDMIPAADAAETFILDMQRVRFYTPGAVTGLIAQAYERHTKGRYVGLENHDKNEAFQYLQRIDFFKTLGIDCDENFKRHDPDGRFVPVQRVTLSTDVTGLSTELAECVCGKGDAAGDAFLLVQYALGEMIANCKQHSKGSGYASAQYFPAKELARIAVADSGRGLLASFRDTGSPHYHADLSHAEAIGVALRPNVSSVLHLPPPAYGAHHNRGVGLSMLSAYVAQTHGYMTIITGDGWCYQNGSRPPVFGTLQNGFFQGTLVAAAFNRGQIGDYAAMRRAAQEAVGLHRSTGRGISFT